MRWFGGPVKGCVERIPKVFIPHDVGSDGDEDGDAKIGSRFPDELGGAIDDRLLFGV